MQYKREIIKKLEADKSWLVSESVSTNRIVLVKQIAGRTVSAYLVKGTDNRLTVEFPCYEFVCRTSNFRPREAEKRVCYSQTALFQLENLLRRTGVWEFVENKEFYFINENNKKSDKDRLKVIFQRRHSQLKEA